MVFPASVCFCSLGTHREPAQALCSHWVCSFPCPRCFCGQDCTPKEPGTLHPLLSLRRGHIQRGEASAHVPGGQHSLQPPDQRPNLCYTLPRTGEWPAAPNYHWLSPGQHHCTWVSIFHFPSDLLPHHHCIQPTGCSPLERSSSPLWAGCFPVSCAGGHRRNVPEENILPPVRDPGVPPLRLPASPQRQRRIPDQDGEFWQDYSWAPSCTWLRASKKDWQGDPHQWTAYRQLPTLWDWPHKVERANLELCAFLIIITLNLWVQFKNLLPCLPCHLLVISLL